MRRLALLPLLASLAAPTAAGAAELPSGVLGVDALRSTAVATADAVRRECTARPLQGARGVTTRTYRAAATGEVTFRLAGRGDWDLAVFDRTGRLAASSSGFGGQEVAQVGLVRGAEVLVQACRRTGTARRATLTSRLVRLDLDVVRAAAKERVRIVDVHTPTPGAIEALEAAGLDVTHEVGHGHARVVAYGAGDLLAITRLGLVYEVVTEDAVARARRARAADAELTRSLLPTERTTYRSYDEIQTELKAWVEQHADLARPVKLDTKSFQGREIQAVEISEPGDEGRPVFFLGAVHHAREWPAAEAAMEFGWDLLLNGRKDPQLKTILRDVRTIIMPLTNPDGYIVSRANATTPDPFGAVSLAGTLALGGALNYKRKNCNPLVPGPAASSFPCQLTAGVDNNRNYSATWGGPGSSTSPNSQSYRGPAPFSEPETRAVQEVGLETNTIVHQSIHNIAAKVLRPPGLKVKGDSAPDREALTELGQLIADATGYANEVGYQLYDTTGTSKDWGYDSMSQFHYTIEMGPAGGDFQDAYETNVIDQYNGVDDLEGRGLREGLIQSALYTRRADQTARLTGTAAKGAVLRIKKDFLSETSPVCALADPVDLNVGADGCQGTEGEVQTVPETINMTMTVPASGKFEWWLAPSTRPFVQASGGEEKYTVTCEVAGMTVGTPVEVAVRRGETKAIDLGC